MIVGVFGQTVTLKSSWINSRLDIVKKLIDVQRKFAIVAKHTKKF
jgi:hypothetical protein